MAFENSSDASRDIDSDLHAPIHQIPNSVGGFIV